MTDPGWTLVTLHAHLTALNAERDVRYQQRFDAQTQAVDAAITAQRTAVDAALVASNRANSKAEEAADKRFALLNELRSVVTDQAAMYMLRRECEQRLEAMIEKVDGLAETFRLEMKVINERLDRASGSRSGINAGWTVLVGAVGLVLTILLIYGVATR